MMHQIASKIADKTFLKKILLGKQEELKGKLNLSSFHFRSYLPHTNSSLNYSTLSYLLNDILINDRSSIIEFGSGISTIYMAKLAEINKKKIEIVSVDHDENWIRILKTLLTEEDLSQNVTFINSGMKVDKHSLNNTEWFDGELISKNIKGKAFDLVIVDGPIAYTKSKRLSRFPALPFINNYLSEKHAILLDDTNRKGESQIIKMWENQFGYRFKKLSETAKIASKGDYYNIV